MPAVSEPYDAPAIVTFAKELEAFRSATGLNKKQLAEKLGFTDTYIGQIELCKNIPSEEFAEALDTFFETNGSFRRLRERIIETRHATTLPPGFSEYVQREGKASSLRAFDGALVNGLLQTPSYARTVLGANQLPETLDQHLSDRLTRQEILTGDSPPRMFFTIDEVALRRMVGGPEVMREQLRHLLEVAQRPNVSIDVIPIDTGYHEGLTGGFKVLGFEDGSHIAYSESSGMGLLIEDPARVTDYLVRYDLINGYALPVERSQALIANLMEAM